MKTQSKKPKSTSSKKTSEQNKSPLEQKLEAREMLRRGMEGKKR